MKKYGLKNQQETKWLQDVMFSGSMQPTHANNWITRGPQSIWNKGEVLHIGQTWKHVDCFLKPACPKQNHTWCQTIIKCLHEGKMDIGGNPVHPNLKNKTLRQSKPITYIGHKPWVLYRAYKFILWAMFSTELQI